MARKRNPNPETDFVVSSGATPATRRNPAGPLHTKHAAAPAESSPPQPKTAAAEKPTAQQIAQLAYSYWESRGCQGGSSEEDWLRAERELHLRGADR